MSKGSKKSNEKDEKFLRDRREKLMEMLDSDESHEFKKLLDFIKKKHGLLDKTEKEINQVLEKKIAKVGAVHWLDNVFGYGFSKGWSKGIDFAVQDMRWVDGKLTITD